MGKRTKLTAKQQRFVDEYLVDFNAARAARDAGYSEHTAKEMGYENLTKPHVVESIREAMQKAQERTEVTIDYVIGNLVRLAKDTEKDNPAVSVRANELLARHVGAFEADNFQKHTPPSEQREEIEARLRERGILPERVGADGAVH